ncbi:LysR family transcriptional regulator [Antrihabitans cavernicola]|uniref:LysR family transcriptional regulator n=1 Tax=Antrihabitans cavernicola TaxID=2495913 RepID=A0A5A7S5G1_9NOCA|nr:LysR family transcriptional regulator [Spelaeibacter cavernicola]KAA0021418.1 LysR family transcriptional regulator [Spelaeibacter cavernicola]
MELRQLTYFVAVSEELSFSRAAQRCFISQSAISHQIARLERDLDATLFDRSTRAVTPTDAGLRLLPLAQQMLGLQTMIYSAVRAPGSRIRLAANMSFAARSLSAIADIRARHPDAEVEFVIKSFHHRIDAVASGDADVALIRGHIDRADLQVKQLWVEDLIVATAATHPLAQSETVNLGDLADYPLLMPPAFEQVLLHKVIRESFEKIGATPMYGAPIPSDHTATMELISYPDAWTVIYAETPATGISCMREAGGRLRIPVSAVTRSGAGRSILVEELIAFMTAPTPHRQTG